MRSRVRKNAREKISFFNRKRSLGFFLAQGDFWNKLVSAENSVSLFKGEGGKTKDKLLGVFYSEKVKRGGRKWDRKGVLALSSYSSLWLSSVWSKHFFEGCCSGWRGMLVAASFFRIARSYTCSERPSFFWISGCGVPVLRTCQVGGRFFFSFLSSLSCFG